MPWPGPTMIIGASPLAGGLNPCEGLHEDLHKLRSPTRSARKLKPPFAHAPVTFVTHGAHGQMHFARMRRR